MGPRNHVLDLRAYWRRLANTIERSVRGGDAVLSRHFVQLFLAIIRIFLENEC